MAEVSDVSDEGSDVSDEVSLEVSDQVSDQGVRSGVFRGVSGVQVPHEASADVSEVSAVSD